MTIAPPRGSERIHLTRWATPRLLRYFKSIRQKAIDYHVGVCGWDTQNVTMEEMASPREMEIYNQMMAEVNYVQGILNTREHVKKA